MTLERTLDRACYVGRAPEGVGSYRVVDVAGESVLIVRGEERLNAFYNLCRHRGFVFVCLEPRWKVILENYNECYHCAGVHPELSALVPAFKHRGGSDLDWERGVPHAPGAWTYTKTGTSNPNFMCSLSAEHVAAFRLVPVSPERTLIAFDSLFHPEAIEATDFDPSDAVDFWDLVNRQDWTVCEGVQRGMHARPFETGFYAPMESLSLDIRRYIKDRLG